MGRSLKSTLFLTFWTFPNSSQETFLGLLRVSGRAVDSFLRLSPQNMKDKRAKAFCPRLRLEVQTCFYQTLGDQQQLRRFLLLVTVRFLHCAPRPGKILRCATSTLDLKTLSEYACEHIQFHDTVDAEQIIFPPPPQIVGELFFGNVIFLADLSLIRIDFRNVSFSLC